MEQHPMHPNVNPSNAESASPNVPIVYEDEEYYWQYKCIKQELDEKSPLDEERLNELGKEGWELVTAFTQNDKTAFFYFKRLQS